MIHTLRARRQQPRDVLRLRVIRHTSIARRSYRAYHQVIPTSAYSSQHQCITRKEKWGTQSVPANVIPIRYNVVVVRRGLVKRHATSTVEEATTLPLPLLWILWSNNVQYTR